VERKRLVTALYDSLEYDLDSADPKPHIWWDSRWNEAEQFNPIILGAIDSLRIF